MNNFRKIVSFVAIAQQKIDICNPLYATYKRSQLKKSMCFSLLPIYTVHWFRDLKI